MSVLASHCSILACYRQEKACRYEASARLNDSMDDRLKRKRFGNKSKVGPTAVEECALNRN